MKVTVNFFKPSGKWYTDEVVEIPDNAHAWDFSSFLPENRFLGMYAVTEGLTPWGFPAMTKLPGGSKEI